MDYKLINFESLDYRNQLLSHDIETNLGDAINNAVVFLHS